MGYREHGSTRAATASKGQAGDGHGLGFNRARGGTDVGQHRRALGRVKALVMPPATNDLSVRILEKIRLY